MVIRRIIGILLALAFIALGVMGVYGLLAADFPAIKFG